MTEIASLFWFGRDLPMDTDLRQFYAGKFHFIKLMAHRMCERRGIKFYDKPEFEEAMVNFLDFLAQSDIEFGDPDFDWTPAGAFDVADEYAIYDDME